MLSLSAADEESIMEQRVSYWIGKPIHAGYLLSFSVREHSSENIRFLIAVEEFRNHLGADPAAWDGVRDGESWQDIDRRMGIGAALAGIQQRSGRRTSYVTASEDETKSGQRAAAATFAPNWDYIARDTKWTSTTLQKDAVLKHLRAIWDTYCAANAQYEICIDKDMLARTGFRLRNVHQYGPLIFEEATIDPTKTVKKDVLPRFLTSALYRDLKTRLKVGVVARLLRGVGPSSAHTCCPRPLVPSLPFLSIAHRPWADVRDAAVGRKLRGAGAAQVRGDQTGRQRRDAGLPARHPLRALRPRLRPVRGHQGV